MNCFEPSCSASAGAHRAGLAGARVLNAAEGSGHVCRVDDALDVGCPCRAGSQERRQRQAPGEVRHQLPCPALKLRCLLLLLSQQCWLKADGCVSATFCCLLKVLKASFSAAWLHHVLKSNAAVTAASLSVAALGASPDAARGADGESARWLLHSELWPIRNRSPASCRDQEERLLRLHATRSSFKLAAWLLALITSWSAA